MIQGDSARGTRWLVSLPDEELADVLEMMTYYGTNAFEGIVHGIILSRQFMLVEVVDNDVDKE